MAWYLLPDVSNEVLNDLEKTLQFLDKEGEEIILLGDANCDILSIYPSTQQGHQSSIPLKSITTDV